MLLSFYLNASWYYPPDLSTPTLLGDNPVGIDGLVGRVFDWFTYFTILSNLIAAMVMTLLFIRPTRYSKLIRVLRLDSLLMIVITGIIYNLLLDRGVSHEGLDFFSYGLQHVTTPILTVLVWLIVGPRNWINFKVNALSLIIPIIWAAFALAFVGLITVLAIILALVLISVDAAISALTSRAKSS